MVIVTKQNTKERCPNSMITQEPTQNRQEKLRRERRKEYLERRRKVKKLAKKLRPVKFDSNTVTEVGNFQFLELFKQLIDLPELIASNTGLEWEANRIYQPLYLLI